LVAARDEYINQLKYILTPLIIQGLTSIYEDSVKVSEGKMVMYTFQGLLKNIPKWNQTILEEESKRIKKKCTYIMDIVTAIFVSNVKILASIRFSSDNENIKIKIPTSDLFIHSVYIESAFTIFYNPYLFYTKNKNFETIQQNKAEIKQIVNNAIDQTIRRMLPIDNILQEYLAKALNDNVDSSSESSSSGSESDEDCLNTNNLVDSDDSSDSGDEEEQKSISVNPAIPLEQTFQPIPIQQQQHQPVNISPVIQQPFQGIPTQQQIHTVPIQNQPPQSQFIKDSDSDSDSDSDHNEPSQVINETQIQPEQTNHKHSFWD
jgi:hypothetical protein